MPTDVTVFLAGYPTKALHDALTRPVTEEPAQVLTRVPAAAYTAGGNGSYTGIVYAGSFEDVTMADLETFFRAIPAGAYGLTQGIVMVAREQADPIVVNRLGWMPPTPQEVSKAVPVG